MPEGAPRGATATSSSLLLDASSCLQDIACQMGPHPSTRSSTFFELRDTAGHTPFAEHQSLAGRRAHLLGSPQRGIGVAHRGRRRLGRTAFSGAACFGGALLHMPASAPPDAFLAAAGLPAGLLVGLPLPAGLLMPLAAAKAASSASFVPAAVKLSRSVMKRSSI